MQMIVSRTSHQENITGSAEEVILAPSRQGPQITENTNAAAFAQDPIVAVTSDDLIVTGTLTQNVVTAASANGVVSGGSEDHVH